MKLTFLEEPELDFGTGRHICPRAGIATYGVYDTRFVSRRDRLLIGAVGTSSCLQKLGDWLTRCATHIPGKQAAKQPNLFPAFCGFNRMTGFRAELVFNEEITKALSQGEIKKAQDLTTRPARVQRSLELYFEAVKFLAQNRQVDVIVCVVPDDLFKQLEEQQDRSSAAQDDALEDDDEPTPQEENFRRALKAICMHLGKPLQLILESSLDASTKGKQDEATKAWNFCTALYYKANQTVPWKLVRNINKPPVCAVGIAFYRSRDLKSLSTSLAQIFDELGNGLILRGTPVSLDKDNLRPYLDSDQAEALLLAALKEYRIAMDTLPGRLVIHKSSNFRQEEIEGFRSACKSEGVRTVDFVTIMDSDLRLFRHGNYPPYRGTCVSIDASRHLLYSRGSSHYYQTYTGLYIPQPLEVRIVESEESPDTICREVLALTKMNWNNTQFDGKYPITLGCARKVGQILKYLDAQDRPQIRYSYYM